MTYTPVSQRTTTDTATAAYTPVSKRVAPAAPSAFASTPALNVDSPTPFPVIHSPALAQPDVTTAFAPSLKTTTPAINEGQLEAPHGEQFSGIAKSIGQQTASNIASAGLTVAHAIDPKVDGLKAEDIHNAFGQELFKNVFGGGTDGDGQIKSIEDRVAETEPKVQAWQKQLNDIYNNPNVNLTPIERFVVRSLSNVDPKVLSFSGVMGSVGLDLTPVGGLEKNLFKKFVEEGTEEGGIRLLKSIGLDDSLAQHYGLEVAKVQNEAEAKNLFNAIANAHATTKAAEPVLGAAEKYTPVVERGSVTRKAGHPVLDGLGETAAREGAAPSTSRLTNERSAVELPGHEESIPKELEPLAEEARKYKTVDEFKENITAPQLRTILNETQPTEAKTASATATGARSKAAGDYLYSQDRGAFDALLSDVNEGRLHPTEQLSEDIEKIYKQTSKEVAPAARANTKLEAMAARSKSYREFEQRSGVTVDSLDATAQKKGFANAEEFYNANKAGLSADAKAVLSPEVIEQAKKEIEDIKLGRSFQKEAANEMPAKKLVKYESKQTGELPEVTGKDTKLNSNMKPIKAGKFTKDGDKIVQELGFETPEEAQKALDDYKELRDSVKKADASIRDKVKNYRDRKAVYEEVKRFVNQEGRARRERVAAVQEFFHLTEGEMSDLLKGQRDIRLMGDGEFNDFMKRLEGKATEYHFLSQARVELAATIFEKELVKVDNLRKALKLPKIENMTAKQLNEFNELLQPFKQGDEFLTTRKLETVGHTDLKGIKTLREAREKLLEQINIRRMAEGKPPATLEDLNNIKVSEYDRYKYDTALARQNPLYDLFVQEKNKAFLTAEEGVFEAKELINELFNAARRSRKNGFLDKLIPTDNLIFKWLESPDAEKLVLAKDMTKEELDAAMYVRDSYGEMRDYLVQQQVLKKFRSDYITHIRRGFLEAWKEEGSYAKGVVSGEKAGPLKRAGQGLLAASKEVFQKFAQDAAYFNIMDQATDQVLPLEKFFQYSMRRSGELVPSKNVAKAYIQYLSTFEKKKALDSIIPKLDIYVHSLTPKLKTPRGLEFDASLKKFFKEWMNTKKGRATSQALIKPGGKIDWALRTGVAFTRLMDLGLSVPVGLASNFGAQISAYRGLGEVAYAKGLARMVTPKGRAILNKYAYFTGESVLSKIRSAEGTLGDSLMSGVFGLFSTADRKARQVYLLGKMTPEEFAAGKIPMDKLARMQTELGRHMPMEGSESIIGKTALGKVGTQYKSWAVPLLSSTLDDISKLGRAIQTRDLGYLKTPEGAELLRTTLLSTVVGVAGYSLLTDKTPVKNQTFTEKIAHKAAQDALSLIGALDPSLWTGARLLGFLQDLSVAIDQIVTIQKNKDGELTGVNKLESTLTPAAVRQLKGAEESATKPAPKKSGVSGVPDLPKLPKLPQLPKLPKISL